MASQIVLLRGVNLGPNNRIAMPELRSVLSRAGFEGARTYVQSGNVVLSSDLSEGALAAACERQIAESFGLQLPVIVRSRDHLAEVVDRNPLADIAEDPKRYQVSFLAEEVPTGSVEKLAKLAAPSERLVAIGRELYSWHPAGVARSKLWSRIASPGIGVTATARNWSTVTRLLALASEA